MFDYLSRIGSGIIGAAEAAVRTVDPIHPRDPALARMFGFGQPTHAGVRVNHDSTMAIPAIYRGINILGNGLSRVPFYVFKVDQEDESKTYARGHTSWKSVAIKPSPELKQVDFRRLMTSWAVGWGNAVAHIHRPGWPYGGPVELTPLLPDRTFPVRITDEMVKNYGVSENLRGQLYYQTRISDIEMAFPADDCLHIRGLGGSTYWGYDVVTLLHQALGGAIARAEFGHRFYGQGANPAGFVETPVGLSEEAFGRFRESMQRGMEGLGKAHRVMLLEEGAKFHQWMVDPEKAQFLEGLQFDYRVLANIIGVKVHKLVDGANSSYNSLEQSNSEHRDDDLYPWINQWRGEYNDKMLTENQRDSMSHVIDVDDEYLDGWVPYLDKVRGVVEAKNNGLINQDEGRRKLNFGPSRDRNGRRFTMPMNIEFVDDKAAMMDFARQGGDPTVPKRLPTPDDDPGDDDPGDDEDNSGDDESAAVFWTHHVERGDHGLCYADGKRIDAVACNVATGQVLVYDRDDDGVPRLDESNQAMTRIVTASSVVFLPTAILNDAAATTLPFGQLREAWLGNIRTRLGKQAARLATKDVAEFITWVDSLKTEQAPELIQGDVDRLYAELRSRLLKLTDQPIPTELSAAVRAEVNHWSDFHDDTNA